MLKPLVAAAAATIVGISASAGTGDRNAAAAGSVDKVSCLTAVGAFGRESYVWVAKEKGFLAYARLAGVDIRTVRWVHAETAQLPAALAAGQVEGIGTFVVARPSVEKAARGRTVVATLSGAGVLTGPLEPDDVVAFDTTVGGVR